MKKTSSDEPTGSENNETVFFAPKSYWWVRGSRAHELPPRYGGSNVGGGNSTTSYKHNVALTALNTYGPVGERKTAFFGKQKRMSERRQHFTPSDALRARFGVKKE